MKDVERGGFPMSCTCFYAILQWTILVETVSSGPGGGGGGRISMLVEEWSPSLRD